MKYLICLTLLLAGCATKPDPQWHMKAGGTMAEFNQKRLGCLERAKLPVPAYTQFGPENENNDIYMACMAADGWQYY